MGTERSAAAIGANRAVTLRAGTPRAEHKLRAPVRALLAGAAIAALGAAASAETFVESSSEFRLQLDYQVPDAALAEMIPEGFEPNIAQEGPAKDANIRVIFVDRISVNSEDGEPIGTGASHYVYLQVPVRQTGTENTAQLIIGGITDDPAGAPGPFGNWLAATQASMERSTKSAMGEPLTGSEDWVFEAAGGEHFEVHLTYERAPTRRSQSEPRFYSASDPSFYQINRVEQNLDIMENVTTGVDRVSEYEFQGGGGMFATLFDGTEKLLSVDAIPFYTRSIYTP